MDKLTLLAVDDTKMNRDMLKVSFKDDYNILEASSGKEALEILNTIEVDIVITDIFMEPMNGYQLIKEIRKMKKYEYTPLIAVTESDEASQDEALASGADSFVCRPFVRGPLKQCVKIAMYKQMLSRKQKELESSVETVRAEDQKEIERLTRELSAAQSENLAKTDFLSRVSHDMRTPLNGILGLTTLMKDKIHDDDLLNDLSELEISGKFLLNLINDTLDISRIERGQFELHPSVCDGRSVFNNIVKLAHANIDQKNITLDVHADNIPFTIVYIDASRLEQAIMNIIGNSIKFTPAGGTITLTVKTLESNAKRILHEFTIEDTGIGMSEEFLPKLFEPFTQENTSKTEVRNGTGLGMTLTKQTILSMDGSINVESKLNEGTKVTMIVPIDIATKKQIKEYEKNSSNIHNGINFSNKRVLLCEDHPLNARIAKRILEKKDMIVDVAANGVIGLEKFSESPIGYYDVILMDIRMPEMDGIDATKAIRKLERKDSKIIPIVAMTANAFNSDVMESRAVGMNAHLAKPIDVDLLFSTLAQVMTTTAAIKYQKILVVDDMEVNRAVVVSALEDDYEVIQASSGKEALDILNKVNGIDVVITDINMPDMDGFELTKEIRKNREHVHIAIIGNTEFGAVDVEEKMLGCGANDFIYKPTTPKIVKMRVRSALRKF